MSSVQTSIFLDDNARPFYSSNKGTHWLSLPNICGEATIFLSRESARHMIAQLEVYLRETDPASLDDNGPIVQAEGSPESVGPATVHEVIRRAKAGNPMTAEEVEARGRRELSDKEVIDKAGF